MSKWIFSIIFHACNKFRKTSVREKKIGKNPIVRVHKQTKEIEQVQFMSFIEKKNVSSKKKKQEKKCPQIITKMPFLKLIFQIQCDDESATFFLL